MITSDIIKCKVCDGYITPTITNAITANIP